MRLIAQIIIFGVMGLLTLGGYAADRYPFHSQTKRQQFVSMTQQLRCLVCQNESLASSNAPLALDLKRQVYKMVRQGKTSRQIKDYLVKRYGDFVLFKPPLVGRTYLLWFAPVILLLLGLLVLVFVVRNRKTNLNGDSGGGLS